MFDNFALIPSHAGAALNIGVTPVEITESVYQAVPYVGMAKVFDVLHSTDEVLKERGVELPLPPHPTTTPENRAQMPRGPDADRRGPGGGEA